jgi:hypothetical protein
VTYPTLTSQEIQDKIYGVAFFNISFGSARFNQYQPCSYGKVRADGRGTNEEGNVHAHPSIH